MFRLGLQYLNLRGAIGTVMQNWRSEQALAENTATVLLCDFRVLDVIGDIGLVMKGSPSPLSRPERQRFLSFFPTMESRRFFMEFGKVGWIVSPRVFLSVRDR
jgi:hypothetical protein